MILCLRDISNTQDSILPHNQKSRSLSTIISYASNFQLSYRCLEMWSNTVFRVSYFTSKCLTIPWLICRANAIRSSEERVSSLSSFSSLASSSLVNSLLCIAVSSAASEECAVNERTSIFPLLAFRASLLTYFSSFWVTCERKQRINSLRGKNQTNSSFRGKGQKFDFAHIFYGRQARVWQKLLESFFWQNILLFQRNM